jgi:CDGSH-type Zn-finger protein/uncharacterized Fe-S cluster protein YjdI
MSTTSKLHRYEGTAIAVTYDAARCIHAAECVHALPAVFNPRAKPWINADGAGADELAAAVRRCPTGALHVERRDGVAESPERTNTAMPTVDGPTYLRGDFALLTADGGVALADTRMALCRCGASQSKPFCDGSHRQSGFNDDATLRAPDSPPPAHGGGRVAIRARPNGPLMLTGPLTLVGANGRRAFAESTFLCRCGASGNKPYCDGTHKKIEFTA